MEDILSWTRIIVSLVFLIYASLSDLRTREVSNNVWIIYAPTAFLLTFAQILFFPSSAETLQSMVNYGISFVITSVFSIALFYIGAFGGADAKALICIALAMPLSPDIIKPLSEFVPPIFPITIFSNSVIIAALSTFYALFRNLLWRQKTGRRLFEGHENASFGRKALVLLSGYKVSVANLEKSFLFPLEDLQMTESRSVERHLLVFPKDEARDEIIKRLSEAEKEGKLQTMVWATPGLPMLIFITIGLILALTVGDIVWLVISQIL